MENVINDTINVLQGRKRMMNQELKKIIDALPVIKQIVDEISYITVIDQNGIIQGLPFRMGRNH